MARQSSEGNTPTGMPLKDQFARIEFLVRAVGEDKLPGLILCGPPGWAKTFTVRNVVQKMGIAPVVVTVNNEHAFVHTLRQNAHAPVIVADDTDQLASRPSCLNIAKGAFGPDHEVVWESRLAQKLGLQRFKIKSRLIWISNRDYANPESRREDLEAHWGALASRGIRPIWLDTTNQEDAFRYVVRLACTSPAMWHLKQPLNKSNSEKVIRWFCDKRDHLLEISPRTMTHIISAFHVARDDIKQRDALLNELLALEPQRELQEIVVPTIVGHTWKDVPEVRGTEQEEGREPTIKKKAKRARAAEPLNRTQKLLERKSHLVTDFRSSLLKSDAVIDEPVEAPCKSWDHIFSIGDRVFNLRSQRMATIRQIMRQKFDEYGDADGEEYFQSIKPGDAHDRLMEEDSEDFYIVIMSGRGENTNCLLTEFCLPEEAERWRGHECM